MGRAKVRLVQHIGRAPSLAQTGSSSVVPNGAIALPPETRLDTSAASGGLDGFLGNYDPDYIELTEAVLVAGVSIQTSDGTFETLEVGDEEEPPEATMQVTVSAIFDDGQDAQSKLSAAVPVNISDGSWSGFSCIRLENPVLLTPGKYRVDFAATLSESYEFDPASLPKVDSTLIVVKFEKHFFTDVSGVRVAGIRAFTDVNLDSCSVLKTPYVFAEDDEPPIAVDFESFRMSMVDWAAYLISRAIDSSISSHRRTYLADAGFIESSTGPITGYTQGWQKEIELLPGYDVSGYSDETAGGGAFLEQQTYKQALGRIMFEVGAVFDWTGPVARIIIIPRAGQVVPAIRTITLDDVERVGETDPIPNLSIAYTDEDEVINTIDPRYRRDYSQGRGFEAFIKAPLSRYRDASSVGYLGTRSEPDRFWFDWGRSAATLNTVVQAWLNQLKRPLKIVEFVGFLDLLELQRGDVINFNLTPTITIGPTAGAPDANQGYGDGGYGSAGYGGSVIVPPETIIGESFDTFSESTRFMIESALVDWDAKRVKITARELGAGYVPG